MKPWLTRLACSLTLLCSLLLVGTSTRAQEPFGGDPEDSAIWQKVRASLFQSRPIIPDGGGVIALDTPVRAEDAAVVPIAIRALIPQSPSRAIDKVYLVIDNNPSPISAIVQFTLLSGRATLETRVRIDQYTHVRAIAETSDGQLYMVSRFVKASGGCSAPPAKDAQAALAGLGRMKLRTASQAQTGQPVLAQLMISHPNSSGLAMDQISHLYTPAHFVRQVRVSYQGQLVMSAELDISISENPNLRFYFVPDGKGESGGELKAEMVDTNDLHFATGQAYPQAQ